MILFTDQWMSPIAGDAAHAFSASVEAPSGWDSSGGLLFLTETMISAVEKLRWKEASKRMQTLEVVFDSTQQFRDPDDLANIMWQKGFQQVEYKMFMFGTIAIHVGRKPIPS